MPVVQGSGLFEGHLALQTKVNNDTSPQDAVNPYFHRLNVYHNGTGHLSHLSRLLPGHYASATHGQLDCP